MSDNNFNELTFVLLKPLAVERGLCGEIIRRFENAGFVIKGLICKHLSVSEIEQLYYEHMDKTFYEKLVHRMSSNTVVALALAGNKGTISKVRRLIGSTDPVEAKPGTIRGDLAHNIFETDNLIHASDSIENAKKELTIFFPGLDIDRYFNDFED